MLHSECPRKLPATPCLATTTFKYLDVPKTPANINVSNDPKFNCQLKIHPGPLDCWTTGDVLSVCHSAWTWEVPSPASLTLACTLEVLTYLGTLRWVSVFTPLDFDRWCAQSSSWGSIQIIAVWCKCILGHQSPWAVSKASLLWP